MKFTFKKGTHAFVGSVPFTFLEDAEVETQADSPDHLAELLAAGPQRAFGEHLEALKHEETITKDIKGEPHEVTIEVAYGAGGARLTREISEPRKIKPKLAAAAPGVVRSADAPTTVPTPTDPLAEKAREEFKERTEFRPPPKRFPDEIQTATDRPVDATGNVVEGDSADEDEDSAKAKTRASAGKSETSDEADKSKAGDKDSGKAADKDKADKAKATDDKFPVDFPGRTHLLNASPRITRPSQLKGKTAEDLQEIPHIGPETADKILEALEALK